MRLVQYTISDDFVEFGESNLKTPTKCLLETDFAGILQYTSKMIRIFEIQFGKPIFISVAQNPRALVRYGIRKIHADSRFQYGTKLMMLHTVALTRSIKHPTKRQIVKS